MLCRNIYLLHNIELQYFFQVPAINLHGHVVWLPNEFLLEKLPHLSKVYDKRQLGAVAASRLNWLSMKNQALLRYNSVFILHIIYLM